MDKRLNQEAAKALAAGRKAGFDISEGRDDMDHKKSCKITWNP